MRVVIYRRYKKLLDDGLISNNYLEAKRKEFRNFLDGEFFGAKEYKIKMKE